MSIAEHITVFISIIIGLAVGDLLISFHRLIRARARVQWDWLPLGVALFGLLLTINYWWLAFSWYASVQKLTVADFVPTLAQLVVLFLLVAASLPDDVPEQGVDLEDWYFGNARLYWSLASISLTLDIIVGGAREVPLGGGLLDLLRVKLNSIVVLPFVLAMIFVRRRWYHVVFMAVSLANMAWLTIATSLRS